MDTVDVHVRDAGVRVVAARHHVVVSRWLGAEFLGLLAGDGVEADVGVDASLVVPHFGQEVAGPHLHFDDLRAHIGVAFGQPVGPELRMFDQMIVRRDQLHVVLQGHVYLF